MGGGANINSADGRFQPGRNLDPINLAAQAPTRLGALTVTPALRQVVHDDGREQIIEPRVMQVLVALLRDEGQILTRDDLLASCWGGVVVGEDAITRVIGSLRRLSEGIAVGVFKLETITKVGFRLVASNAKAETGLPSPALIAAASPAPRLAVLAFDNLSGDAEMAYFSDGVSEEILQTVARGAELKVIGRGSSFQFRGPDKAAAHVAAALDATHVLDGSVRRSGSKVRIAANLIECAHETTIWSERFDRELSDVFALQDEIAAAVAAALKVAFSPAVQAESVDPAAYTLYLRAREIRNRGLLSPETVVTVIGLLREATTLAPRFARAWEFLATMEVEYLRFDQAGQPQGVERADVVAATETALRLDPGLGAAHQALGALEPFGRFAEREAFHMKALAAAPHDATVLTNLSLFFAEVGRMHAALEYARQAYALDPMYPWAASWYAVTVEFEGRSAECRALWERFTALWPDNELIAWGAICAAYNNRDWIWFDEQVAAWRQKGLASRAVQGVVELGGAMRAPSPGIRRYMLDRAREILARTGVLAVGEFKILYDFDLKDETFELVAQASFAYMFDAAMGSPNGAVGSSMIFDANSNLGMMRDPSFVGLCAKLGLCDYWVNTGRWPDCAELAAPVYDFKAECRKAATTLV